MDGQTQKNIAIKISIKSIIINIILTVIKLISGLISNSSAMVSDAVHSASDVFSTIVVMIGVTLSSKEEDRGHPYGHERLECVAAIILSVILCMTGVGIGITGFNKILLGLEGNLEIPGSLALVAAIISVIVKEWMFWFTRNAAKKVNSGALMADAWHHRSDSLSSIGGFVGILGARLGLPILDPVACLFICFFIIKAAYDIFKDAIDKMTDCACDEETVIAIQELILHQDGVQELDMVKTRLFGSRIYVDVEIAVDNNLTLEAAHCIAQSVHNKIEDNFEQVKHCMVHVNPSRRVGCPFCDKLDVKDDKLFINEIHHVAIIVSDYEKSKNFYVNILGFQVLRENYRADRNDYKLDLKIGNSEIEIFSGNNNPSRLTNPESYGLRHLAFKVFDVEMEVKRLNSLGVLTQDIKMDPFTDKKTVFFFDPDGLPLELYQK